MPTLYALQANFTRGEISPRMQARVDTVFYKDGLQKCLNWLTIKQGGLRRRSGTIFVKEVKDSSAKCRLLPFNFGTPANGVPQAYVLEMGNTYFRVMEEGGVVAAQVATITGVSLANPAHITTAAAHGLTTGDPVLIAGVVGPFEVNGREFAVTVISATVFSIPADATGWPAYVSGGTVAKIVEVATSWTTGVLPKLDYAQSADTLTVTHKSTAPADITRSDDTVWSLNTIVFKDGPYFDEPIKNTNGVTLSATGAIHPFMTDYTAPSGTVFYSSDDVTTQAWRAFDGSPGSYWNTPHGTTTGSIGYEPAAPVVANSYWLMFNSIFMAEAPSAWTFQGWDGTAWIILDRRQGETAWAPGETRFFDFINVLTYSKYQLSISGNNSDPDRLGISEIGIGYNGDFAPAVTATFDNLLGINKDAGFNANDVGRMIRIRGSDGYWRWIRIATVTSTTIVAGPMYGYAFPDIKKTFRWQLGAWRKGSYPAKVGYYQARRAFARSIPEPANVWFSKAFDFADFGVSTPGVDDDAIRVRMLVGQVNAGMWLEEDQQLAVGTTDGITNVGTTNANAGFGASNFTSVTKVKVGCAEIKPVRVGQSLIYADHYGTTLREFVYDLRTNGYIAPNLTVMSDHLLESGAVALAYQAWPDTIVWIATKGGHLVALTYDREQQIVGMADIKIAGGDDGVHGLVESVVAVPGVERDEVYMIVNRSIGGVTRRYIEQLAPEFGDTDVIDDAVFLDSALTYRGAATDTVTGLWHLAGLTVDALADGMVFRDLMVTPDGGVTLPAGITASTITVGLRYVSVGESLRLATMGQDGVHLGRRATADDLKFDVHNASSLKVQGLESDQAFEIIVRDNTLDPASGALVPRAGVFDARFEGSWRDNGQFRFLVNDPVPCTVRAAIIGVNGDP